MPSLWRLLLKTRWRGARSPLVLCIAAWLWLRMQRFGPRLPSPPDERRSLLEHVQRQRRSPVPLRSRALAACGACATPSSRACAARDPIAAALDGEAQAELLAERTGLPAADIADALRCRGRSHANGFPLPHRPPDRTEKPTYERHRHAGHAGCSSHAITGEALAERAAAVREEVAKAFIGQAEVLDQILIALLAGGHVLIEGVPGLGKTLLVRALAQALDCNYARVQFTPDLMPSDISGHAVYDPKTETLQDPPRPGVHQPAAGRRNQPRAGQDAVGAAGSDAGRAGHHRRQAASRCRRRS